MTARFTLAVILTLSVAGLAAAAQIPGLNAGTVTASVDGVAFSATVSVATVDEEGTLILTNLGNAVQIQIPEARVGTFELAVDEDGGAIGVILGLKVGDSYVTPISGSITIETLDGSRAAGTFAFDGKDLADESTVSVIDGRFSVKLTGGS